MYALTPVLTVQHMYIRSDFPDGKTGKETLSPGTAKHIIVIGAIPFMRRSALFSRSLLTLVKSTFLAKYLMIRKHEDDVVSFLSLYKDEDKCVMIEQNEDFSNLEHNAIQQTFKELYREEIRKAMEE